MNTISGNDVQQLVKNLQVGQSTHVFSEIMSIPAMAVVIKEDTTKILRLQASVEVKAVPYCEEGSVLFTAWIGSNEMFANKEDIIEFTLPLDEPQTREYMKRLAGDTFGIEVYIMNEQMDTLYQNVFFAKGREDLELQKQLRKVKIVS